MSHSQQHDTLLHDVVFLRANESFCEKESTFEAVLSCQLKKPSKSSASMQIIFLNSHARSATIFFSRPIEIILQTLTNPFSAHKQQNNYFRQVLMIHTKSCSTRKRCQCQTEVSLSLH